MMLWPRQIVVRRWQSLISLYRSVKNPAIKPAALPTFLKPDRVNLFRSQVMQAGEGVDHLLKVSMVSGHDQGFSRNSR